MDIQLNHKKRIIFISASHPTLFKTRFLYDMISHFCLVWFPAGLYWHLLRSAGGSTRDFWGEPPHGGNVVGWFLRTFGRCGENFAAVFFLRETSQGLEGFGWLLELVVGFFWCVFFEGWGWFLVNLSPSTDASSFLNQPWIFETFVCCLRVKHRLD